MFSHNLGPLCVLKGESAIAGPAAGPGAIKYASRGFPGVPRSPRGASPVAACYAFTALPYDYEHTGIVWFWRRAYFRNPLPGMSPVHYSQVGPFCGVELEECNSCKHDP